MLEGFAGGVPGIGPVGVNRRPSGVDGSGTHPAADGFVVGEGLAGARVIAAEAEVVHGAGAGGGGPVRGGFGGGTE